jgi:hypothetical protein
VVAFAPMPFVYPLFAMFLLTLIVGVIAFMARVRAVRSRQMRLRDFEMLNLEQAEPFVARSTRHIANLFEVPILFYAVCLVALTLLPNDVLALRIAWGYVLMRCVHTCIHLTYNKVTHRLLVFWGANVALLLLWVRVLIVM